MPFEWIGYKILSHDRYTRPIFHERAGSENEAMFVIHD